MSELNNAIKNVANAIRSKTGKNNLMKIGEMPEEIESIPTGITPTGELPITTNDTYDVTNYATAVVNVPSFPEPTGTYYINENGASINIKNYEYVDVEVPSSGIKYPNAPALAVLTLNENQEPVIGFINDQFIAYSSGGIVGPNSQTVVDESGDVDPEFSESGVTGIVVTVALIGGRSTWTLNDELKFIGVEETLDPDLAAMPIYIKSADGMPLASGTVSDFSFQSC